MLTLVKRIVTDIIFDLVLVARKFFGKTSDWLILVRMQIWHWFRIDSLAVNAQRRKLCGRIGRLISGYIRALPGSNIEQFLNRGQ